MKLRKQLLIFGVLGLMVLAGANVARADTIDFVAMANLGEHGESPLIVAGAGWNLTVTATNATGFAYPYLDAGFGGLGVCGVLDAGLQCNPSSDDNATSGDALTFVFDVDVFIDKILMNNNHDGDKSLLLDTMTIGGALHTFIDGGPGLNSTWSGPSFLAAGTPFVILNQNAPDDNKEFYVSAISFTTVPEPLSLTLIGFGLLGVGALARRRSA